DWRVGRDWFKRCAGLAQALSRSRLDAAFCNYPGGGFAECNPGAGRHVAFVGDCAANALGIAVANVANGKAVPQQGIPNFMMLKTKHLPRYKEIARLLWRHGRSDLFRQLSEVSELNEADD